MNIVNKLTWRYMMKNKRQTLVTIIGIIISVAMVTAVVTIVTSFMDLLQRQTINDTGEWHVKYEQIDDSQLTKIRSDDKTKDTFLSRDIGFAELAGGQNEYKPYVYLMEFDKKGFEKYPIHLTDGRLPENSSEVLIPEHVESNGQVTFEIGDEITWKIGNRIDQEGHATGPIDQTYSLIRDDDVVRETLQVEEERTVTVVGFIERPNFEPSWAPGYTVISYLDEATVTSGDPADISVILKDVTRSLYKDSEQLATSLNIDSTETNSELLRYYGVIYNEGIFLSLMTVGSIIMGIIIVGSVSLIYNAFAISVSERSRHLGMLSSVGATRKQKRNSVFFEGIVIGLFSIPFGIGSGLLGMAITFYFINDRFQNVFEMDEQLIVSVTPLSLLLTCLISLLTIFISTYIPAIRASRVSAIDAMRQSTDVKLTRKSVKTSRLVRWIFGFEAEIGLKNLKRNKKRYIATIFSLFISIVLFLSVTYFTQVIDKVNAIHSDGYNYDILITFPNEELLDEQQATIDSIKEMAEVTKTNFIRTTSLPIAVDLVHVPESVTKYLFTDRADFSEYNMYIHVLEDDALTDYAKKVGVRPETLMDGEKMTAIIPNYVSYYDQDKNAYTETQAIMINPGEKLPLDIYDFDKDERIKLGELEVVATTNDFPMGVMSVELGGVNVIISESTYEQMLMHEESSSFWPYLYVNSSDPLKTEDDTVALGDASFNLFNSYKMHQDDEELTFILSVFIYGFISLITLISIANIFNTISTSISLRKREFGMLKSVGMTPKGFNKMIRYESLFYGIKALLYGVPVSIGLMYLMYRGMTQGFEFKFYIPWIPIAIVVVAVFLIVSLSMLYSISKVKKENIIDALKQENI